MIPKILSESMKSGEEQVSDSQMRFFRDQTNMYRNFLNITIFLKLHNLKSNQLRHNTQCFYYRSKIIFYYHLFFDRNVYKEKAD
jgi:hypothetical protein